jgi:peptidoglycan hydrolase-like protein with peptidoglycan-binding domain
MNKFQEILNSFSVKKTLNPKVWENPENPEKATMLPKVRKALMRIAEEFIDYLGEDVFVENIVLTGSLSNFNWSEYSDFDLHVYVNLEHHGKDAELYKELYNLKKQIFNDKHDIRIFGYDVELYAQDTEEPHYSSGVYSIMNDEWINKPKKLNIEIDKSVLEKKIKNWIEKIDKAIETSEVKDDEKILDTLKDKLKEYRKSGLEKDGELSYENLVFKFLRRSGHIEKLFDMANKVVDKELSVERTIKEQSEDISSKIEEFLKIFEESKFLKELKDITEEGRKYEYTPGLKIPYSDDVKQIQTALQFLGFSLPKWGVDGKFGPETEMATKKFQETNQLPPTGVISSNDLKTIVAIMTIKNFKDSDLGKIKTERDFDVAGTTDENFYKKLLEILGAPSSNENLKFLYAWRQAEGKAGKYNPFNTTHSLPGSTNFNKVGVKNYLTIEDGLSATIKTLKNGRYSCIVDGLKNDIGASEIAKCESLHTWGTGDLVAKVVNSYNLGASPKIGSLA